MVKKTNKRAAGKKSAEGAGTSSASGKKLTKAEQEKAEQEKAEQEKAERFSSFSFLEYYPATAKVLARWANAVALLRTLRREIEELDAIAHNPIGQGVHSLFLDADAIRKVSWAVQEASDKALEPVFAGDTNLIDEKVGWFGVKAEKAVAAK